MNETSGTLRLLSPQFLHLGQSAIFPEITAELQSSAPNGKYQIEFIGPCLLLFQAPPRIDRLVLFLPGCAVCPQPNTKDLVYAVNVVVVSSGSVHHFTFDGKEKFDLFMYAYITSIANYEATVSHIQPDILYFNESGFIFFPDSKFPVKANLLLAKENGEFVFRAISTKKSGDELLCETTVTSQCTVTFANEENSLMGGTAGLTTTFIVSTGQTLKSQLCSLKFDNLETAISWAMGINCAASKPGQLFIADGKPKSMYTLIKPVFPQPEPESQSDSSSASNSASNSSSSHQSRKVKRPRSRRSESIKQNPPAEQKPSSFELDLELDDKESKNEPQPPSPPKQKEEEAQNQTENDSPKPLPTRKKQMNASPNQEEQSTKENPPIKEEPNSPPPEIDSDEEQPSTPTELEENKGEIEQLPEEEPKPIPPPKESDLLSSKEEEEKEEDISNNTLTDQSKATELPTKPNEEEDYYYDDEELNKEEEEEEDSKHEEEEEEPIDLTVELPFFIDLTTLEPGEFVNLTKDEDFESPDYLSCLSNLAFGDVLEGISALRQELKDTDVEDGDNEAIEMFDRIPVFEQTPVFIQPLCIEYTMQRTIESIIDVPFNPEYPKYSIQGEHVLEDLCSSLDQIYGPNKDEEVELICPLLDQIRKAVMEIEKCPFKEHFETPLMKQLVFLVGCCLLNGHEKFSGYASVFNLMQSFLANEGLAILLSECVLKIPSNVSPIAQALMLSTYLVTEKMLTRFLLAFTTAEFNYPYTRGAFLRNSQYVLRLIAIVKSLENLRLCGSMTFALGDVPQVDLERYAFSPVFDFLESDSLLDMKMTIDELDEKVTAFILYLLQNHRKPGVGGFLFLAEIEFLSTVQSKSDLRAWVSDALTKRNLSQSLSKVVEGTAACEKHFFEESFFRSKYAARYVLRTMAYIERHVLGSES